jgi:hypothetical protein
MLILKTTSFFLIQKTVISKLLFNTLFLIYPILISFNSIENPFENSDEKLLTYWSLFNLIQN